MVSGLLEGAAFLAARVQLKLKHEFPEFTNNLLEQLVPHYLAPTPRRCSCRSCRHFRRKALREGHAVPRGSYLDASFRERDRQIACRYRLCCGITRLAVRTRRPRNISPRPAQLRRSGLRVGSEILAGMRLTLTLRTAARAEDEAADRRSAEETRDVVRRLPHRRSAAVFHRPGSGCGRALRAAVRPLQGHLFPLSRLVRRSGGATGSPGVPSAGRVRARRRAVSERHAGFRRLRPAA